MSADLDMADHLGRPPLRVRTRQGEVVVCPLCLDPRMRGWDRIYTDRGWVCDIICVNGHATRERISPPGA